MICRQLFGNGGRCGRNINMNDKILKSDLLADKIPLPSPKVLKREVYERAQEAHDVVAQAQEKAREIIEEAERQRDVIREQAKQEGHASGLAEWNQRLAQTGQRADELVKNWEETMLRLSVRVAEKIIGEQLKLQPDTVVDIVREVLKGARPGRHLILQVNEADVQPVPARLDRLRECT